MVSYTCCPPCLLLLVGTRVADGYSPQIHQEKRHGDPWCLRMLIKYVRAVDLPQCESLKRVGGGFAGHMHCHSNGTICDSLRDS